MIFLYLILLLGSFILTYLIRVAAIRHKIIDVPNGRSSHDIPTPRGGGLAIVLIWFAGISVFYQLNYIAKDLYFALLAGIPLAIVSLIDDVSDLKPQIRIIVQFITAVSALYLLGGIKPFALGKLEISSGYILYPLAIMGILWFINLFNFLDGIDAYSSLEAILIASGILLFTGNLINLILIACVAGFLYWNWPKARIFMGDVGSTQLGFILIVLGLYFHTNGDMKLIHWIMLSSLFWFDATQTLFRRILNKEKLSVAHKKHAYQRIVQAGYSHKKTVLCSVFINLIIIGMVMLSVRYEKLTIPLFIANIIMLFVIGWAIDRKLPFRTSPV